MSVLDGLELLRGDGGRGYGFRGADIVQAMGNPKRMQAQGRWGTEKYCILGVLEGVWRLVSGICK